MVIVFDTLFAGLDSVEVIALQMNPLSVMAPDAFTNLYKLKTVNLYQSLKNYSLVNYL